MYFQAAYMNGDFWKISGSVSGFTQVNLSFGLIYAVNGFSPYVSVPYFLYQCRKGYVPKLDQVKKYSQLLNKLEFPQEVGK